jgi:hypothetical protein
MATFHRCAGATVINATVENNAGTDAGSHRGIEDLAISPASPRPGFSKSCGVGVIVDCDFDLTG